MITIGVIVKAQGIKGEVKIYPLTDNTDRFANLEKVYIKGKEYGIESVKELVNGLFIKLAGVNDRNASEALKGANVEIERKDAVKPEEGRYLIVDVIGSKVVADGVELGILTDILQNGCADVYCVSGDKPFMFPALKDVIIDIDTDNKIITLEPIRLQEVAVYED